MNNEREINKNDFDGHTAFHSLSFTQKLTWLSKLAVSVYMIAKENPGSKCNLFFTKDEYNGENH